MDRRGAEDAEKTRKRRPMEINEITEAVIGAAIEVHRHLGPGLLESVYETILAQELKRRGCAIVRQVSIPIQYHGIRFEEGFRADLIVENKVLLELKSVEQTTRAHAKQVLTYLKLTGMKLGYLLNFGEALMRDGITRIINGDLE